MHHLVPPAIVKDEGIKERMSDTLQPVVIVPYIQPTRNRATDVRYASEALAKFNFSFSPGLA